MNKDGFSLPEYVLVFLVFIIALTGAASIPMEQCPDEKARSLVSDWIEKTGTLPSGNEWQTMNMNWEDNTALSGKIKAGIEIHGWGFSYALRPYLTAILSAVFLSTAKQFTTSPRVLLTASRMGSVLSLMFCCIYCLRLGHRLFERRSSAAFLAAFVCFLPQVMFLGMYQNNDVFSLLTVCMMLYYWVEGYERKWPMRSCIALGVSCSLGLLSYYTIYGWILMIMAFCVLAVLSDTEISDKRSLILKRTALIALICFFLAGWFFIRNVIIHDGDIWGLRSEEASRNRMREQGYLLYDYVRYRDTGRSIMDFLRLRDGEFLRMTGQSFIGVFGYMVFYLSGETYGVYGTVIGFGVLIYVMVLLHDRPNRLHKLLILMMLISGVIVFALHIWSSYARDYQPQGRYVITIALILGYMISYGLDRTTIMIQKGEPGQDTKLYLASILTVGWTVLFAWSACSTMSKMLL
ncbi:MAG: glycosyltransferase family 39 protein [Clostridia bacterium]|nr:glycosyltransferase family 39 protein [Clostridia bacterium]